MATTHLTPELTNFRNILKKSGFPEAEKLNYPYLFQNPKHPTSQKNFEKVIEWYLKDFNLNVTKKLQTKGYDFLSLEGAELISILFKISRDEFKVANGNSAAAKLSITQFKVEQKFLKQKILFLTEIGEQFLKMRPKKMNRDCFNVTLKQDRILQEKRENGELNSVTAVLDQIKNLKKTTGGVPLSRNGRPIELIVDSLEHIETGASFKKISSDNIESFGKETSSLEIKRNRNPKIGRVDGPSSQKPPLLKINNNETPVSHTPVKKLDYLSQTRLDILSRSTPMDKNKKLTKRNPTPASSIKKNPTSIVDQEKIHHYKMMNKLFDRISNMYSVKETYTHEDYLIVHRLIEQLEKQQERVGSDDFALDESEYQSFMSRLDDL